MRKMSVCFLSVILLIFALTNPLYAYNALDKFARGATNLLVSPLELFQGIANAMDEHPDNIAIGLPVGICKGSWNTVKRAGIGLFEIITFPFPYPPEYTPILDEPIFFKKELEK